MTLDEIHQFFKMYADKTTSLVLAAFEQEEIDDWVNSGIRKFTETRYSGVNPKREAFEQTQKRIDDLRTLVAEETLTCSTGTVKPNSYIADLTSLDFTYWLALGEEVLMGYQSVNDADTEVASGSLVIGEVYRVITDTVTNAGTTYAVGDYFVSAHADYTGSGACILQSQSRVPVTESTIREASLAAMDACTPIDDVRGSAKYRKLMVRNLSFNALTDVWGQLNQITN